jgi:3-polyprenyl-4-hydroxybenzoate decarboxylase
VYSDDDLFAPIASGSYTHDGMIICPCSESTLGKIASGIADTLITRAAAVAMKEGRKLIIVPRETPLSTIMIENELKLARAGAIILPAAPGFYSKPTSVAEMVDFVVGKVLDQLGQKNELYHRRTSFITGGKASRRPSSIDEWTYPMGRNRHQGDHTIISLKVRPFFRSRSRASNTSDQR